LAIARRIAREHGGDLTYADGGRGARFELRLPAVANGSGTSPESVPRPIPIGPDPA
jgi:signal transduction histidine kinase